MKTKTVFLLGALAITSIFARTGLITWDFLNLRAGPGTKYKKVRNFQKGKYFEILGKDGNWIEVNANGLRGYFYMDGIKEVKTIGEYLVKGDGVLFQWGPGERYDTLAIREGGISVEVVWAQGIYLFGQFNGSGVWFDSSAVIEILESEPPEEDIEPPLPEEIPDMPVVPPAIVEPVEPKIAPIEKIIPKVVEKTVPKEKNRFSYGLMLAVSQRWVRSVAVDSSENIIIPTVEIGDSYRQLLFGMKARANLSILLGEERRSRLMIAPAFEYIPKKYIVDTGSQRFKLRETYLMTGLDLGFGYEVMEGLVVAGGPTVSAIRHKMDYGADGDDPDIGILDSWFFSPGGFADVEYGAGVFNTVLGVGYKYWRSDNTRFFIADDGGVTPVGGDLNRHAFEVYFGIMLSR